MKRRKGRYSTSLAILGICTCLFIGWQLLYHFNHRHLPVSFDSNLLHDLHYIGNVSESELKDLSHQLGYDVRNSRAIHPQRAVVDTRHSGCQSVTSAVRHELPSPSIIITFTNVDRSVLLRTVVSILTKSRHVVIRELILVDDGSANAMDGSLLAKIPGVKIVRFNTPIGRGMARMKGAALAKGDVIVFVDCFTEVNVDWLSPLLVKILQNPKSVVSPVYDVIDQITFQYRPLPGLFRGGFDWSLQYHWEEVPALYQSKPDPLHPYRSPACVGNVFAINKAFFNSLGRYDPAPNARETEDMELSLRIWLCGGQIEIVPCSRVGHIHIKGKDFGEYGTSFNNYLRSARRIAEVWLDEYKRFFYATRPSARMQPMSDISSQRKLKEKLQCKSFKWYLSVVYPQLQPLISDEVAYGYIRQQQSCIDVDPGQLPLVAKLRECQIGKASQEWSWRKRGVIVSNGMCLTSDLTTMQGFVVVQFCKDIENQIWYRHNEKIVHHDTNLCLDGHQGDKGLVIMDCIKGDPNQSWMITNEKQTPPARNNFFDSIHKPSF